MKFALRRWVLAAAVASAGLSSLALLPSHHAKAANQQGADAQEVAAVEKLKTEAFHELRGGHFDKTNELLNKAAAVSHDPQVGGWRSGPTASRPSARSSRPSGTSSTTRPSRT